MATVEMHHVETAMFHHEQLQPVIRSGQPHQEICLTCWCLPFKIRDVFFPSQAPKGWFRVEEIKNSQQISYFAALNDLDHKWQSPVQQ